MVVLGTPPPRLLSLPGSRPKMASQQKLQSMCVCLKANGDVLIHRAVRQAEISNAIKGIRPCILTQLCELHPAQDPAGSFKGSGYSVIHTQPRDKSMRIFMYKSCLWLDLQLCHPAVSGQTNILRINLNYPLLFRYLLKYLFCEI